MGLLLDLQIDLYSKDVYYILNHYVGFNIHLFLFPFFSLQTFKHHFEINYDKNYN